MARAPEKQTLFLPDSKNIASAEKRQVRGICSAGSGPEPLGSPYLSASASAVAGTTYASPLTRSDSVLNLLSSCFKASVAGIKGGSQCLPGCRNIK